VNEMEVMTDNCLLRLNMSLILLIESHVSIASDTTDSVNADDVSLILLLKACEAVQANRLEAQNGERAALTHYWMIRRPLFPLRPR
jgi:hypothetical protein